MRRAVVFLLLLLALLLGSCAPRRSPIGTVTVAAVLPLSGEFAPLGRSVRDGIEVAFKDAGDEPMMMGNRPVRAVLRVEDDRSDPAAGEAVVRKLGRGPAAVIAGVLPAVALAIARTADETRVVVLVPAATDPQITEGSRWVFRVCFDDQAAGSAMATYAYRNLGARRAALIYDRTAASNRTVAASFRDGFRYLGGEVVAEETFQDERTTADFRAVLERAASRRPDVIFSPNHYRATATIAAQARAMRLPAVLLSGEGANAPDFALLGGEAVEGAAFPVHYAPDDPAPSAVQFRTRFREAQHRDPDALAALGYDAARLLLAALRASGSVQPEAVRDAVPRVRLAGATGTAVFSGPGDPEKDVAIVRIRDGRPIFHVRVRP